MGDRIEKARLVVIYGILALVIGVVILDRFTPAFLSGYEPLGDAALGLLLGAIAAAGVGETVARMASK